MVHKGQSLNTAGILAKTLFFLVQVNNAQKSVDLKRIIHDQQNNENHH